jgi:exosortase
MPALMIVRAILLIPIRIIHEINQDWPLISWTLTLGIVGISLYAVYLAGGWPWVRHFAFPVCFILVAVKWPYRIEHPLTQSLMRVVANIGSELLGWMDIPAMQRGNLIELSTGLVGVDEACSGIRSLQSSVMGALFLGELYLFRWPLRLVLLGSGIVLAFLLNITRAVFLAWQAASDGISGLTKWHDSAGLTIVLICFAGLWLVAWIIQLRAGGRQRGAGIAGPSAISDVREQYPGTSSLPQPSRPNAAAWYSPFFAAFACAAAAWTSVLLIGNELWYRPDVTRIPVPVRWWVNLPTNAPTYQSGTLSAGVRKLLRYDKGVAGSWIGKDGAQWSVFCLRWRAGNPTARTSALGHRPEYCMVGSGHELKRDFGIQYLEAHGLRLPFRTYAFDSLAQPLHVFFCLWEDGAEQQRGFSPSKYRDRLRATLARRRGLGQQTLEIIVKGFPTMSDAENAVRSQLPRLIRTDPRPSSASVSCAPEAGRS